MDVKPIFIGAVFFGIGCGTSEGLKEHNDTRPSSETDAMVWVDASRDVDASLDVGVDTGMGPGVVDWSTPLGGERPTLAIPPPDFDPSKEYPLVLSLHGFTAWNELHQSIIDLEEAFDEIPMILLAPNGTRNPTGARYWNASKFCCDFFDEEPDDVGYLRGLLEEAMRRFPVDPSRVFVVGHSNGGFMAYRLACEASDVVTGVVSIAGSMDRDLSWCVPTHAVTVLQVHGAIDPIVFSNGLLGDEGYLAAKDVVDFWGRRNGCEGELTTKDEQNFTWAVGRETERRGYDRCNTETQYWWMRFEDHVPFFYRSFNAALLQFLNSHPRVF